MRYLLSALFLLLVMQSNAQSYKKYTDDDIKHVIYQGKITFDQLDAETTFDWWTAGKESYQPDADAIAFLKEHLKDYTIVTVLGTWCPDSHDMVPEVYKVLQEANYPMDYHLMFAVDLQKKGLHGEENKYKIQSVPTVILYKNGKEVGRIVETVATSVEADMMEIINSTR